ncbi:NAD-dependent epimerase/dehydratase [Corallincola platygyrae]
MVFDEGGNSLERAFQKHKPDVVINTAALYGRKGEADGELLEANVGFPLRLLEYSISYGASAFINTGTSLPRNVSMYALTKNSFVELVRLKKCLATKFINLELEHFFGPGDDFSKFTSFVTRCCLQGKELKLTAGLQERDFIYVDDVVSAYDTVISELSNIKHLENISVGLGEAPAVRYFVEMVKRLSNSTSKLEFGAIPTRPNELMHSCANTSRLKELGWQPSFTLEEGVAQTLEAEASGIYL